MQGCAGICSAPMTSTRMPRMWRSKNVKQRRQHLTNQNRVFNGRANPATPRMIPKGIVTSTTATSNNRFRVLCSIGLNCKPKSSTRQNYPEIPISTRRWLCHDAQNGRHVKGKNMGKNMGTNIGKIAILLWVVTIVGAVFFIVRGASVDKKVDTRTSFILDHAE